MKRGWVVGTTLFACIVHGSEAARADESVRDEPPPEKTPVVRENNSVYQPDVDHSVFRTVIVDNLLGVSTSTSGTYLVAPFSLSVAKGRSPNVYFLGDVQFRVLDFLTLGVKVRASSEQTPNTSNSLVLNTYTTRNSYYFLARVGGVVRITDRIAFWPSLALGPAFDSSAATSSETGLLVEGELAFAYSLMKNVFFAAGPGLRGRAGKVDAGVGVGFNARLGLTF